MECWNTGMMEYWVQKGKKSFFKWMLSFQPTIPIFHYSFAALKENRE